MKIQSIETSWIINQCQIVVQKCTEYFPVEWVVGGTCLQRNWYAAGKVATMVSGDLVWPLNGWHVGDLCGEWTLCSNYMVWFSLVWWLSFILRTWWVSGKFHFFCNLGNSSRFSDIPPKWNLSRSLESLIETGGFSMVVWMYLKIFSWGVNVP